MVTTTAATYFRDYALFCLECLSSLPSDSDSDSSSSLCDVRDRLEKVREVFGSLTQICERIDTLIAEDRIYYEDASKKNIVNAISRMEDVYSEMLEAETYVLSSVFEIPEENFSSVNFSDFSKLSEAREKRKVMRQRALRQTRQMLEGLIKVRDLHDKRLQKVIADSTCVEEELLNPLSRCQELLSEFGKNTRVVPDLSVLAIGSSPTEGIDPLRLASDVSLLSAEEDHLHPQKRSDPSSTFPSDNSHSSSDSADSLVDTAEPDAGGDQDLLVRLRSSDQELIQKLGSSLLVEGRFQMTLQFEEIEKSYGNLIEWITSSMNPLAEKRVRTRLVFSKVKTGSSAISKALMSIKEFFSKISVLNGATDILSGVVDQFCNVFACSSLSSSQESRLYYILTYRLRALDELRLTYSDLLAGLELKLEDEQTLENAESFLRTGRSLILSFEEKLLDAEYNFEKMQLHGASVAALSDAWADYDTARRERYDLYERIRNYLSILHSRSLETCCPEAKILRRVFFSQSLCLDFDLESDTLVSVPFFQSESDLPRWVAESDLRVMRSFSDYELQTSPGNRSFFAMYEGVRCVLEMYSLEERKSDFLTQLWFHKNHRHYSIMYPEGFFIDQNKAFLHCPLFSKGSIYHWKISDEPNADQVRNVFRQIFEGLEFIHSHGYVLGKISPSTILIHASEMACIRDLSTLSFTGMPEDSSFSSTFDPPPVSRTFLLRDLDRTYVAPELLDDDREDARIIPSCSSDVFAMGILLYKALTSFDADISYSSRGEIVLVREKDLSAKASELLRLLLRVDPSSRLSITEALQHSYFSSSAVRELEAAGRIVRPETKRRAIMHSIRMSNLKPGLEVLSIDDESNMFQSFLACLDDNVRMSFWLHRWSFRFSDGRSTSNLKTVLNKFFSDFRSTALFESLHPTQLLYLPLQGKSSKKYKLIGKILGKCFCSGISLPCENFFSPIVLRYIASKSPGSMKITFRDVEVSDPQSARKMQSSLLETNSIYLPEEILSGSMSREEYLDIWAQNHLVTYRSSALSSLRDGFLYVIDCFSVNHIIDLIGFRDLQYMLTGPVGSATHDEILRVCEFSSCTYLGTRDLFSRCLSHWFSTSPHRLCDLLEVTTKFSSISSSSTRIFVFNIPLIADNAHRSTNISSPASSSSSTSPIARDSYYARFSSSAIHVYPVVEFSQFLEFFEKGLDLAAERLDL